MHKIASLLMQDCPFNFSQVSLHLYPFYQLINLTYNTKMSD
ncbi:hypothetical protein PLAN_40360 [Planktothrix rubescens CCAP 1459/22]|uniref:Uncharacterized protein n=1 Tax=Planktothrix rubescens CCAP 1459/22 TaxID=329571 RepID=A0A6J7ZJ87_PLARU|nr:hypothetical protein PLAN_40360 [Planktothrix rubescens NIVA-CYA 18]CAD0227020.1 hypothetical protein PL10110_300076 [Planktothrix agardhii]